jgi:hypothetical protein
MTAAAPASCAPSSRSPNRAIDSAAEITAHDDMIGTAMVSLPRSNA